MVGARQGNKWILGQSGWWSPLRYHDQSYLRWFTWSWLRSSQERSLGTKDTDKDWAPTRRPYYYHTSATNATSRQIFASSPCVTKVISDTYVSYAARALYCKSATGETQSHGNLRKFTWPEQFYIPTLPIDNKPFPSSLVPLFQNESKCETFHIKMSSACRFILMQIKVIFIRMVSHLDSLWNRGTRALGNGLLKEL